MKYFFRKKKTPEMSAKQKQSLKKKKVIATLRYF